MARAKTTATTAATTRASSEPEHTSLCDQSPCRCGAAGYSRHPTKGWMYNQLERLGLPVRGIGYTDSQLAEMLRQKGYDVSASPRKAWQEESDR